MYEIEAVSIYCTVHIYTVNKSQKQCIGTSNKLNQAYYERKCYEKKLATSFYKVKGRNDCTHVKEAPYSAIFQLSMQLNAIMSTQNVASCNK